MLNLWKASLAKNFSEIRYKVKSKYSRTGMSSIVKTKGHGILAALGSRVTNNGTFFSAVKVSMLLA